MATTFNPLRSDPSRTGLIRQAYEREMLARFAKLAASIERNVGDQNRLQITVNAPYKFVIAPERLNAFTEWLQRQIDRGLLTHWQDGYVKSAYRHGMIQAWQATQAKDIETLGSPDSLNAFLREAFDTAETTQKLQQLYGSAFELLKGLTADMAQELRGILVQGIADGKNPRAIGRELAQKVEGMSKDRGVKIARTEVIHASAEAQLDAFDRLGIETVGAEVEWLSTPDQRRCELCAELHGKRFTLDEARGKLPRHPSCRCAWVPVV